MASVTSSNRQLIFMAGVLIIYLTLITLMMSLLVIAAYAQEIMTRDVITCPPGLCWPPKYKMVKVDPVPPIDPRKDYIITKDHGGKIGEYLGRYRYLLKDTHIIVDGLCNSACTLVLANKDVCVTDKAVFGFHAASSENGTNLLMTFYPEHVKVWLAARGGLTINVLFARGDELAARCKP